MIEPVTLSTKNRAEHLQRLQQEEFDLLVIGGGITGAGIALDAAARNLKVALLEMQDFAAGTSSRSTKLIHGGLRYLQQFEFKLVREVARERAVLHQNAPHLVVPERMLLPLFRNGQLAPWLAYVGVSLYDWLAGVKPKERMQFLSAGKTIDQEPLLDKTAVKTGILYVEYRTDDARLTIEVVKTAAAHGALCLNYLKVQDLILVNGKVAGVAAIDLKTQKQVQVRARQVINATGPWLDEIRAKSEKVLKKRLYHTKGVHLVVPRAKLPVKQSMYFEAGAGRMIFVIPRNDMTYLGTTDTPFQEELANPVVTEQDVAYLLNIINTVLPDAQLQPQDICSSWAGIRPLIYEAGKSPSAISRKDEIWVSESGLISVAGGKLTAYRKMAEKVVDVSLQNLSAKYAYRFRKSVTKHLTLCGGSFSSSNEVTEFTNRLAGKLKSNELPEQTAKYLVQTYGKNAAVIVDMAEAKGFTKESLLEAEIIYGTEQEMVTSLSDFLIRRTGRLYFSRLLLGEMTGQVLKTLKKILHLSETEAANQLEEFETADAQTCSFTVKAIPEAKNKF